MVFLGEYDVVFTGQGRISVPKKIREVLSKSQIVLTKGFDQCLAGFKVSDWEEGAQALVTPSLLSMEKAEMKRHIFSGAAMCDIDDQGRIIIPKNLLEYADLSEKSVIVIGVGTHFEIWNPKRWNEYQKKTEPNIKQLIHE